MRPVAALCSVPAVSGHFGRVSAMMMTRRISTPIIRSSKYVSGSA